MQYVEVISGIATVMIIIIINIFIKSNAPSDDHRQTDRSIDRTIDLWQVIEINQRDQSCQRSPLRYHCNILAHTRILQSVHLCLINIHLHSLRASITLVDINKIIKQNLIICLRDRIDRDRCNDRDDRSLSFICHHTVRD